MSIRIMRPRRGLNAIELLVAMGVLATIVGLSIPAIIRNREAAALTTTMDNLGQTAKAVHLGYDQFKHVPTNYGPYGPKTTAFTFHVHLLPFVGEQALYAQPTNAGIVPAYLSPMDQTTVNSGANACNYPVNIRLFYTLGGTGSLSSLIYPKFPGTVPDGVSNTLLFATKYMACGTSGGGSLWLDPNDNAPTSPTGGTFGAVMNVLWQPAPQQNLCVATAGTPQSFAVQSIQVAMCDASVRSVSTGIFIITWQAVHTPGAADPIGPDWE